MSPDRVVQQYAWVMVGVGTAQGWTTLNQWAGKRARRGTSLKRAAAGVIRSHSVFGAFYRRKRAQLGPMQAQVATAHKIARTVYHLLKYKTTYHDVGAKAYDQQAQDRELAHLRKKAAKLGYALTATAP